MHEDCGPVVSGVAYQPEEPDLGCRDDGTPDKSGSPRVSRRKRLSLFQSVCEDMGAGVGGIDCGYSKDDLEYAA